MKTRGYRRDRRGLNSNAQGGGGGMNSGKVGVVEDETGVVVLTYFISRRFFNGAVVMKISRGRKIHFPPLKFPSVKTNYSVLRSFPEPPVAVAKIHVLRKSYLMTLSRKI